MERRHFHPPSLRSTVRSSFRPSFSSYPPPPAVVRPFLSLLPLHCQFVCVFGVDVDWGNCPYSVRLSAVRPSVRPKCSGANGHLEINVWQAAPAPGRCLPGTVSWSDGARGRLDEMSSVWEEEGRERNWRGRPAPFSSSSSPPPSVQSDSWNAPDIKWFVQSHNAAGKGADGRAGGGGGKGGSLSGHSLGWHHRIAWGSLPFLCRSVFVCAPPSPHS